MDTKCAPFFSCGGRGLKIRQKPLRVIFLPILACRDQSQIIDDLDRGSGHRSFTCTVNPKNSFLVVVSAVLHFTSFPFSFFFLLYSSVAQTLKNVGPLDCKLRLLRRRSQLSLGGKISVAEVKHLLTLNVLSANYRVVLVVVAFFFSFFFSFIFSLPFFSFLFLCGDFELFFFE